MKKIICFCLAFLMLSVNVSALNVTWFDNINQYANGNYNRISNFENGYAVFQTGKIDKNWARSNLQTGIIDKAGNIVYGPIEGDVMMKILENDMFCLRDSKNLTSSIYKISGEKVADFDGYLQKGGIFNDNQIAAIYKQGNDKYARCGLVKKSGEVIVPVKYYNCYYEDNGNSGFVFSSSEDLKNADVYNADGSFSHSLSLNYQITDMHNNLLEIVDETSHLKGVADIYGNIILNPQYSVNFISENRIFATNAKGELSSYLFDCKGNLIKDLGKYYNAAKMYEDKFMFSDVSSSYLVMENGEKIKAYDEQARYPRYVGEGIYELTYNVGLTYYIRYIDAETGEFVGDKYTDKGRDFNEGYITVEDLNGNTFVMDKDGNKFCEEYSPSETVSDGVLIVYNKQSEYKTPGIVYMPKYKSTKLIINNNVVKLSSKPQKSYDRTFYPFRECLENLGATVSYNSENKTAVGEYNGIKVEFPIGTDKYYINGAEYKTDAASYIDNNTGRTYIPIRYAAEAFGFTVDWVAGDNENTISIHK